MSSSLFERLGGRDGIANLVDDAVENHMNNPAVNARFLPYREDPDRLAVIKNHTIDFFIAGSGGPANYKGREMPETHKGMNISQGEYMEVVDDIFLALKKNDHDEETQKEVLFILWSLKGMIISK